jgi:purine-binding chemotaxis protein CheW
MMETNVQNRGAELAGKYLTFMVAEECYGLQILKVQEIIRVQPITRVPHTPQYVRGVINLRGKVIPVIDLRLKFGLPHVEDTRGTCIVVVQVQRTVDHAVVMGVIIDAVREVVAITAEHIEDVPDFGIQLDTTFILGIGKAGGGVKILLDIDRVLSDHELVALQQVQGHSSQESTDSVHH